MSEYSQNHQSEESEAPERLALTLDIQEYLGQLEDWDISESQKREFIVAFWNLLVTIAELNLGIHPAQIAAEKGRKRAVQTTKKSPEKTPRKPDFPAIQGADLLYSRPLLRTNIVDKPNADTHPEESESPV